MTRAVAQRLPSFWWLPAVGQPHAQTQYLDAQARLAVVALTTALTTALELNEREWFVIDARPFAKTVRGGLVYEVEHVAAAQLRLLGIGLGVTGTRYVVWRHQCRLHDSDYLDKDGTVKCRYCAWPTTGVPPRRRGGRDES